MVNPFVKQQTDRQYTNKNNERHEIQPTYPSVDQRVVCEENARADVCETEVDYILLILGLCITIGLLIEEGVYPKNLPCDTCVDSVLPFPNAEQQRSPSWSPSPELNILTSANSWFHSNPLCIICLSTEKRVYPEDLLCYTCVNSVLPSPDAEVWLKSPSCSHPLELNILTSTNSWFHSSTPLCIICLLAETGVYPENLPCYTCVDSVLPSPNAEA